MWQIEIHRGAAAEFHARPMPEPFVPSVCWFEVQKSALVLGSSQPASHVDAAACARAGVDIVRRRSGGGAVLLQPSDALWVDVFLPSTDARWSDDIGRSAWWLGDVWQAALATLGVVDLAVHRGPMVRTQWSDRVCFAGVGGGELMRGDAKVVGISQRRTRSGARFQCALYRAWRPATYAALLAGPGPSATDLADLAFPVTAEPAAVMNAFAAALSSD